MIELAQFLDTGSDVAALLMLFGFWRVDRRLLALEIKFREVVKNDAG